MLGIMDLTVSTRFTAAAYGGWLASEWLGWYPTHDPMVLVAAVAVAVLVAVACWTLLAPLTRSEQQTALIGSLGLTYVLQAGFQFAFGPAPRVFHNYPVESGLTLLGITGTRLQWTGLVYAQLATIFVALLLHSKFWGRSLQAVAADPDLAAAVFGLDRRRLAGQVSIVTALILGPIAVVYGAGHGVAPATGVDIGLLAFVATIVAGRQRPLAAAGVALGLVVVRSVAIRWTIWELGAGGLGVVLLLACPTMRNIPQALRVAASLVSGLLCFGITAFAVDSGGLPRWVIPASFQDVIPYLLILAGLLARPSGLFAPQPTRAV
jgi:branched-subunit amino acid ABC-type transport system permease component